MWSILNIVHPSSLSWISSTMYNCSRYGHGVACQQTAIWPILNVCSLFPMSLDDKSVSIVVMDENVHCCSFGTAKLWSGC